MLSRKFIFGLIFIVIIIFIHRLESFFQIVDIQKRNLFKIRNQKLNFIN
jgi:hypothetical protein